MNTEGFSEEVSLERPLKDDGRRGIIGHLEKQSEQRPGPGGIVGRQDQADPRAGDVSREPQQSRLKPFREKPCRKTRYHPRAHSIESTAHPHPKMWRLRWRQRTLSLVRSRLGSSCLCSVWSRAALRTAPTRQHFCPCPSSPAAPTSLPSVPPRPPVTSRQCPIHTPEPSLPLPPRWIRASSHQPAARTPSNTSTTHPQPQLRTDSAPPNLKRLSTCTPEPTTPFLCPYTNVPFRETSLVP